MAGHFGTTAHPCGFRGKGSGVLRNKLHSVLTAWALTVFAICAVASVLAAAPARADIAAYLVFDAKNGAVLDQKNALRPWHPASLTKLMTAYVTFAAMKSGRLKPTSPVYYSANAQSEPPSKMGFKVGTILTVDNALKMVIVKSANDVAVALGEAVSGSEAAFVAEMNRQARALGMTSTRFTNPNGLPDRAQISNARDFGLLAQALYRDYPQYAHYFRIGAIKLGKRVLRSHNIMLRHYPGADGMKTGYICDSGLNLVASARRGGRRIVAVVLGSRSGYERAAITRVLLDRGFSRAGNLFSSSSSSLRNMRPKQNWAALPPKGYCRSGPKPSVNELLARYGRQPTSYGAVAGGKIYDDSGRVRPALPGVSLHTAMLDEEPKERTRKGKKHRKKRKGKKKKGIPAHVVLARLVGPERNVAVIPVYLGGADSAPAVAQLPTVDGVKLSDRRAIPVPHPHRGIAAASTAGPSPAALAIQPVRGRSSEAAAASLFARSGSGRADGRPEMLLPANPGTPAPAGARSLLPRPHPYR